MYILGITGIGLPGLRLPRWILRFKVRQFGFILEDPYFLRTQQGDEKS